MAEVICLGIAVLDHVFQMQELPQSPVKHFANEYRAVGGGNAATAAVAVARAGGNATFIGRLGNDPNARILLDELTGYGVDVSHTRLIDGANSGVSAVLIDENGERMIVNHADPKLDFNPSWLQEELSMLDGRSKVAALADLRWQAGAEALLARAKMAGLPAVLDIDLNPEGFTDSVLRCATHALFSEPALTQYAGTENHQVALHVARERLECWVGFTAGSEGAFWLDGCQLRHQPGVEIKAVDTLGAGDVFHGTFALGLAEGLEIPHAMRFASVAAALKCSRFGGRDAIPSRSEIEMTL